MIPIIDDRIEKYLDRLSHDPDPYLEEMEHRALQEDFPIVDRQVGRLLHLLARITDPKLVVELGSGYGYSAYCFATGMRNGKVILTDYESSYLDAAKDLFKRAGLTEKAAFHLGDAVASAQKYTDIDILFLDLEKERYLDAVKEMLPHIRPGGMVIADNTLWFGMVAEKNPNEETRGILDFNEYMFHSGDFYSINLPLRDGVVLGIKN